MYPSLRSYISWLYLTNLTSYWDATQPPIPIQQFAREKTQKHCQIIPNWICIIPTTYYNVQYSCSAESATLTRFGCSLAAPDQEHSVFSPLSFFLILCSFSLFRAGCLLHLPSIHNHLLPAQRLPFPFFFCYLLSVLAVNSAPRWSVRSLTGRKISDVMQDLYAS